MTYEDRMKDMAEENKSLKRRTGELLIELCDVKAERDKLKRETSHIPREGVLAQPRVMPFSGLPARPGTAQVRKNNSGLMASEQSGKFDVNDAMDELDTELEELMQRNQARLQELHSDFKEVSKLTDEPYVNVRKVKGPARRHVNVAAAADTALAADADDV